MMLCGGQTIVKVVDLVILAFWPAVAACQVHYQVTKKVDAPANAVALSPKHRAMRREVLS